MITRLISIILLLFISTISADESCKSSCKSDGFPLPCGVWLKNETKVGTLGTYELGKGVVTLYCSFSSLPEPVQIQWMFHPSDALSSSQWREFPCAKKRENKNCQKEEIVVESTCEIRTTSFAMSGRYRCSASIPSQPEHRYRAFSSEFPINIVGIEQPKILSSHLLLNHNGHIDVEICANPKPEVFWHTSDGILLPGESSHRFATTDINPRKVLKIQTEPISTVPYCYSSGLLIHKVHDNDNFKLSIRGELSTIHEKLSLKIKNTSTKSYLVSFISIIILYFNF